MSSITESPNSCKKARQFCQQKKIMSFKRSPTPRSSEVLRSLSLEQSHGLWRGHRRSEVLRSLSRERSRAGRRGGGETFLKSSSSTCRSGERVKGRTPWIRANTAMQASWTFTLRKSLHNERRPTSARQPRASQEDVVSHEAGRSEGTPCCDKARNHDQSPQMPGEKDGWRRLRTPLCTRTTEVTRANSTTLQDRCVDHSDSSCSYW